MPFNTLSFLVFFAIFTGIFYSFRSHTAKSFLLIAGSYAFFSFYRVHNLLFLLAVTAVTYITAKSLRTKTRKRAVLSAGLTGIVSILLLAKYSGRLAAVVPGNISSGNGFFDLFDLPLGISFYALQAMGLLADIYGKKYGGTVTLKNTALFLGFFPQSLSGPIHRAGELMPQFGAAKKFQAENVVVGLKTMLWGYFCKLLAADKIAIIIAPVFADRQAWDGLSVFAAALLYSLQLYFDFWGYSLIALGAGRMLGFTLNVNFLSPYSAKSFREFWHRWHITLSRWMRDYIYIPLGGRHGKSYPAWALAVTLTFVVSGFWHGITFNFILWGMAHALLYLTEDRVKRHLPGLSSCAVLRPVRPLVFFIVISFTWLIFRTENLRDLAETFSRMARFDRWSITVSAPITSRASTFFTGASFCLCRYFPKRDITGVSPKKCPRHPAKPCYTPCGFVPASRQSSFGETSAGRNFCILGSDAS